MRRLRKVGVLRPYASEGEIAAYEREDLAFRVVSLIVAVIPLAAAAGAWLVAGSAVRTVKDWADQLAPDGNAAGMGLERVAAIQGSLVHTGAGWLALGLIALYLRYRFPGPVQRGLEEIRRTPVWLLARLRRSDRIDRVHVALVSVLAITATVASALLAVEPVRADEASTCVNYVAQPLVYIVSVYDKTNNHVLHNILAHVSMSLFGHGVWQLRLPSLVAGFLLVPTAYVAIRRHCGRDVALLATTTIATSCLVVDASSNARGYQLLLLAYATTLATLPGIVRGRQGAWLVFVLAIAFGLWTVPIMVYPALIAGVWLLTARFRDTPRNASTFLARLTAAVVSIAVLTLALYSPAQAVSDASRVVAEQSTWGARGSVIDVLGETPWRFEELAGFWHFGRPAIVHWLLLGGAIASPLVAHRVARLAPRFVWVTLISLTAALCATRVYPPFWSLGFLYLPFATFAAVGIVGALTLVIRARRARERAIVGLAVLVLAASVAGPFRRSAMREVPWYVGFPDAREVVDAIPTQKLASAHIDARFANGATINFYVWQRDARDYYSLHRDTLTRPRYVFVVVRDDTSSAAIDARLEEWSQRGYTARGAHLAAGASTVVMLERL